MGLFHHSSDEAQAYDEVCVFPQAYTGTARQPPPSTVRKRRAQSYHLARTPRRRRRIRGQSPLPLTSFSLNTLPYLLAGCQSIREAPGGERETGQPRRGKGAHVRTEHNVR